MTYFKLFEEFNPYTGKEFVEKLKLFAQGSPYAKSVSSVRVDNDVFFFTIETDIPADHNGDEKTFKVVVPMNIKDVPYVETIENGKMTMKASLETKGENQIDLLLMNFIEAAQLYDDGIIDNLIAHYKEIKSVQDIARIIKTQE
jgi:hypothetical protein